MVHVDPLYSQYHERFTDTMNGSRGPSVFTVLLMFTDTMNDQIEHPTTNRTTEEKNI